MTIIQPITAAGLGTVVLRPLPDVQPFTIQSGYSFEGILSDIRVWLRDVLVPYLEDNSAASIFQSNVDTMIDTVNTALTDQAQTVTAALNAAVNEVITGSIPVSDALMLAVVQLVTGDTRAWLDAHYQGNDFIVAKAPSGTDDSAVLKALIDDAQQNGRVVHLQAGTYLCNLDLRGDFKQARVVGAGRHNTTLRPYSHAAPVYKMNGGSGSIGGGGPKSLTIDGIDRTQQMMGIAISGAGGVQCEDVEVQNCDSAVVFWNERPNDFTEFDTFEGSVYNCTRMLLYKVDNGVESFHGSGVVGESVFGFPQGATGPAIQTTANGLPYNAPLSCTFFFSGVNQYLMEYGNGTPGRAASFHGAVRMENAQVLGDDVQLVKGGNGGKVFFAGTVQGLGTGKVTLGVMYLARKIAYDGGFVTAELHPVSARMTLKNTPTQAFQQVLDGGETGLLVVHILGGNYDKSWVFIVYQSPYDGTGSLISLGEPSNIDNAGIGDPTFSWNNGLFIADPQLTTSQIAHCRLTPLGGGANDASLFQQYHAF